MSTLTNIVSVLKSSGLTGAALTSAVQAIASQSPTSAIQASCTTILANSNNPAVVKDMAVKVAEISNLPIAVANLLPSLQAAAANAATDPGAVVQVVQEIETAIGPSTGGLGLNLGSFV